MLSRFAVLGVIAAVLLTPAGSQAGPVLDCLCPYRNCPQPSYSPLHYWAPTLYRKRAYCNPVSVESYPPGVPCAGPPTFNVTRYPCPAVDPTTFFAPYTSPPQAMPR